MAAHPLLEEMGGYRNTGKIELPTGWTPSYAKISIFLKGKTHLSELLTACPNRCRPEEDPEGGGGLISGALPPCSFSCVSLPNFRCCQSVAKDLLPEILGNRIF